MTEEQRPEPDTRFSRASAHRLSQYLRCLGTEARSGGTVSSVELAGAVGVSAAQVRRDLAALGHLGQRGIGYDAAGLAQAIRHTLGIDRNWRAVIVGVGNLARALLRYQGFRNQGFLIVGLFDTDATKIGQIIEGLPVEPIAAIPERIPQLAPEIAVLTLPSEPAQCVADQLVAAGVRGLLNFAPVLLQTPSSVQVVNVDLAIQLEQLAYQVQLRHGHDSPDDAEDDSSDSDPDAP
ncbi:MAG: redox-sensing transcriptional repressor Rex [Bacteroidales bacterium]|nr:redox-sensing transcriptional repressor Rex [Bacteroidales bacterium]